MKKLEGKITVMTGAGCGYGMSSGFPAIFAKEGSHLVLNHFKQDPEGMKKFKESLEACGVRVVLVEGDISEEEVAKRLIDTAVAEFGRIDVLINCAGIQDPLAKTTVEAYRQGEEMDTQVSKADPDSPDSRGAARELLGKSRTLFNIDAEKMMGVMNVNWLGTVIASQVFAVDLVGVEGNSIINITSMAAYDALSMVPAYASSKAAVDMFTRWLSNYLSNKFGKVRVNAVAPGYFLTPLNHDMYVNPDGTYTQRYYNVIHRTPMGRLGDSRELVGALRFFADPDMSGYITGQVIAVDGGFLSCPGI